MEHLNQCPSCRSKRITSYLDVPDHFGQGEVFSLDQCTACNLAFTNPRPKTNEIIKYYKSNSYVSHGQSKGLIFDRIYKRLQQINLNYKHRLIKAHSTGNKLLDFGCGAGSFLKHMHALNYKVFGVEPDEDAREKAANEAFTTETLQQLKEEEFDIITAYHVIEHVHELEATLNSLKEKLRSQGTMHIAFPNRNAYDAQYYRTYWAGYDVPRHLYHFNQTSANKLFDQLDLELIATEPMKLDSYYVSLLSEGYQKRNFRPLRAFWHGYRSNKLAEKTGEFSSLIYILRKK